MAKKGHSVLPFQLLELERRNVGVRGRGSKRDGLLRWCDGKFLEISQFFGRLEDVHGRLVYREVALRLLTRGFSLACSLARSVSIV